MDVYAWKEELSTHPDQQHANFIITGFQKGFQIGFNRYHKLRPTSSDLHIHNPEVVSEYLAREVALNRMWKCPISIAPSGIHISLMGIIPNENKPEQVDVLPSKNQALCVS